MLLSVIYRWAILIEGRVYLPSSYKVIVYTCIYIYIYIYHFNVEIQHTCASVAVMGVGLQQHIRNS